MVHFAEISQALSPYSMLHYIGRVATPKLVPRHCLRYLQTTLIIGGRGLATEFMWGIVWKKKKMEKPGIFFQLKLTNLDVWGMSNGFITNRCTPWLLWPSKKLNCWNYGEINRFLLLKVNIVSIQSVLFYRHAILLEQQ